MQIALLSVMCHTTTIYCQSNIKQFGLYFVSFFVVSFNSKQILIIKEGWDSRFENGVLFILNTRSFLFTRTRLEMPALLRFLCNHPCLPLWATNTVYTNAMRHVSCCVKDVYICLYVFISHVGAFLISPVQCIGPCPRRLVAVGVSTQTDPVPDPNISQMPWQGF